MIYVQFEVFQSRLNIGGRASSLKKGPEWMEKSPNLTTKDHGETLPALNKLLSKNIWPSGLFYFY